MIDSTNEFLDSSMSHFNYPTITRPTHITKLSSTLIDNNFVNNIMWRSAVTQTSPNNNCAVCAQRPSSGRRSRGFELGVGRTCGLECGFS